MKKLLLWCLVSLALLSCRTNIQVNHSEKVEEQYVLLVSYDGFRHDYAEKYQLSNFLSMTREGASAKMMLPSFPSKTFPNHYTLVTGFYPGNHGLVDNKFYDKNRDAYYSIGDRAKVEDPYYYGGTPLWQLLEKKGIKTASYFFVGSETPIQGILPTYYYKYDGRVPNEKRIEQVAKWFALPKKERPRFVTLYFSLVDTEGHRTGPNSQTLKQTVEEADRLLGQLMTKIKAIDLPINVIVVSDHGMAEMTSKDNHLIFIDEKIKPIKDKIHYVNNGMHLHVYVDHPEDKNGVYDYLKSTFKTLPVSVYKKEDTPASWHYKNNDRIEDILLVTPYPYYMLPNAKHPLAHKKDTWGTHGYDPYKTPDMGAIFYAEGPMIKPNYKISSFENVHVYPLITEILGVQPPKDIDGKKEVLDKILKK